MSENIILEPGQHLLSDNKTIASESFPGHFKQAKALWQQATRKPVSSLVSKVGTVAQPRPR